MQFIEYKTRNMKGAYLYAPEDITRPMPLVVWLTGGNDGAQMPLKFSLGKLLDRGEIAPECAVLIPVASYGHNYTTMTMNDMDDLWGDAWGEIADIGKSIDFSTTSLCGWSLGADAAAILTAENPKYFERVCLISNYPKAWGGNMPNVPVRILVGAKEKSAARDWGVYPVERVPGYGHEIGERIWLDRSIDLLGWLTKKEE